MLSKEIITDWFKQLQEDICCQLERADAKGKFKEDLWKRQEGGGGRTRVLENGAVIEKGGVAFSAVHGRLPEKILKALQLDTQQAEFYATGISIVLHPLNPMVPIIHMNTRYFEAGGTKWFGGGIDLTPHYIDKADARYFHRTLKKVCDKFESHYYPDYKKWADDYFFIQHRNETRGIGGIFFDRLSATDRISLDQRFAFVRDVGATFAPVYVYFMNKNNALPYTEPQKQWQLLRRGRYVEFNLVYDKGTKFGLDTNGRTESILMSLPQTAGWFYNHQPLPDSREQETLSLLKKGIDWINVL